MALETRGSGSGRRVRDRPCIGAEVEAVSGIQGLRGGVAGGGMIGGMVRTDGSAICTLLSRRI